MLDLIKHSFDLASQMCVKLDTPDLIRHILLPKVEMGHPDWFDLLYLFPHIATATVKLVHSDLSDPN